MVCGIQINKQLFPLKLILFFWFGAAACLLPYMTIHMRQLGITVEETAIVYTVLPITQVIGPPIAGFIADKLGNYKIVLIVNLIITIITSVGIMFVPSSGDPDAPQSKTHSPLEAAKDQELSAPHQTYASHAFTFWLYFSIRIVFQITVGICFTLLDATTLVLCERHKSSFGKERFWAIFATGLFSPICGLLIDHLSAGKDEFSTNYSPSFHFFNVLVLLTSVTLMVMSVEVAPPPDNLMKNIRPLLRSANTWVLFIVIFILGTLWGFVESFLFWYLLDLNSPKYLLGLTLTTGAVIGLPFLLSSEWFVAKMGNVNLMILALVFYFIRFGGYSLIENPFWCIPFEAMEAFTYHLMWCAAATYAQKLDPEGLTATMVGVVGGLHYGVGRAAGSMIGGSLMAIFNARIAFRIMGYVAGVVAVVYSLIYYLYLRKEEKRVLNKKVVIKTDSENGVVMKEGADREMEKRETVMGSAGEPRVEVIGDDGEVLSTVTDPLTAVDGVKEDDNDVYLKPKERCDSDVSSVSVISATLSLSHPI
ncbi:unnamed protein product [Medioppia subpectinata]|uniref:Major facilitator superfamily associated domain-containing protein n=1 Tax=Medioppia subpectinata TaxID=1979941 RepID=A0A7R9KIE4_9ACAR|nr:unnamed protein product [Medioppia subpectinata]CAG2102740.1 unnamed protein product [Medioppia subpectinata]